MNADDLAWTEKNARDLVVYCEALEESGFRGGAQRARIVANDLIRLVQILRNERSLRLSMQEDRDRTRSLFLKRGEELERLKSDRR